MWSTWSGLGKARAFHALTAVAVVGCACDSSRGSAPRDLSDELAALGCFVLPAGVEGVTRSYRVRESGSIEAAGDVAGDTHHMRAAFHPDGHAVYLTTLARLDPDRYLVHLRTFAYARTDCSFGVLLASSEAVSDTASNTRVYGLVAHPNGRWLYQTTGSSRTIRLYLLNEDGVPLLRGAYDVTRGATVECAQVRRLLLSPSGRKLYSNCNNEDAPPGVELALQTWDIAEDGGLELVEHHTLHGMNNGIADPVLHPSGRWLYQPVGTVDPSAPEGFGAYILIFAVDQDGALRFHRATPVRVFDSGGPVQPSPYTKVFPSTLAVHPDGTHLYAAVNAMLDAETFPHEFVEYRIEEDGAELGEVGRTPLAQPLFNSSHHGGTIVEVGDSHLFYSYLTDYDTIRGGVLQQYRIGSSHRLEPLDIPYVATGLIDARQPIAAPIAVEGIREHPESSVR